VSASGTRLDAALAGGLFLGATAFLARLPRVIGDSDEGLFLYEAKRLLDGKVFYRDVFDLITPGAHYLMAGLFWLFGADMATARITDAVMHGLIVATVYLMCRDLGVRRCLAAAAAVGDLALFRPTWPVASPHWLATCLGLLLLPLLLLPPRRRPGGPGLAAGVLAGVIVAVQQQKGVALAVGVAAFLVLEWALERPRAAIGPWRALGGFAAGLALVVLPLLAALVASAGVEPVWRALVLHPLVNYPRVNHVAWGDTLFLESLARYTSPVVLRWLPPAATGLAALRAVVEWARGADLERTRRSLLLAVMGAAWIASILYYPDLIHLAFIGPMFAVVVADELELGLAAHARIAGVVAVALLVATGTRLRREMVERWRDHPVVHRTPFGEMNFAPGAPEVIEKVRMLVDSPSHELFIAPGGAAWYLWTGTTNPTPYQFMEAGYTRPEELRQIVTILEARRVPFVMALPIGAPIEELGDYVRSHYDRIDAPVLLFRRRPTP
jgi:hypothetical protein